MFSGRFRRVGTLFVRTRMPGSFAHCRAAFVYCTMWRMWADKPP